MTAFISIRELETDAVRDIVVQSGGQSCRGDDVSGRTGTGRERWE